MRTHIEADNVIEIVPEEGIFIAMNTLLDAGDHVVAIFPSYQSLYEVGRSLGCDLSFWQPEQSENGWIFDIEKLESLIQANTKMLVVNFPHNPTGFLPTQAEYDDIVALCKRHDLILFSDEMYRFFEHEEGLRLRSGCEVYDKAVILCGLSKSFGLAGLRVGWLISQNIDYMQTFLDFKFYTTICSSAPSEMLAIIALENHAKLAERNINIVKHNIAVAKAFFDKYADLFDVHYPSAGTITLAELKSDMPVFDFAEESVRASGVMVLPANIMNFDGNYFRLGFGRKDLPNVLEHWGSFVDSHLR
jgi:aspartate/methionine/tyrosine aminotransferase